MLAYVEDNLHWDLFPNKEDHAKAVATESLWTVAWVTPFLGYNIVCGSTAEIALAESRLRYEATCKALEYEPGTEKKYAGDPRNDTHSIWIDTAVPPTPGDSPA